MEMLFSAGGIVYRNEREKTVVLIALHASHHGWVFPKGKIGNHIMGETRKEAAVREVKEETGITGKIIKELPAVSYSYRQGDKFINKAVYYFLMQYVSGDINDHDDEMENVEWLSLERVEERLTYASDREVWRVARENIPGRNGD